LFAGNSGGSSGTLTGETNIKFTGNGSNLVFRTTDSCVGGGNAIASATTQTGKTHTLTFDGFTGTFGAGFIESFDKLVFTGSTDMAFGGTHFDLDGATTWDIGNNVSLDLNIRNVDSVKDDTMNFGTSGGSGGWTVIKGISDDLYKAMQSNNTINIYGVHATWTQEKKDEKDKEKVTAEYWLAGNTKLILENGNLVVK